MMTMSSDKDYKETKLIKQGKQKIEPDFVGLADWINNTYKVIVINIFYDTIQGIKNRPRLSIIFEYHQDELKFRDGGVGNFDAGKQKIIARKFRVLVNGENNRTSFFQKLFRKATNLKYDIDNLLVVFTSFEPMAKEEANSSIPESEVEILRNEIGLKNLWVIYRHYSFATFFFHTDKQVDEYSKNGIIESLAKKYFSLLKKYDEFGYFKEDTYSIMLDSKENFDEKFKSNWFYYSR